MLSRCGIGLRPIADQRGNEFLSRLGEICGVFRRLGKALGIKLQIPDHVLGVDGQRAQRNAASHRVKFIEVVAGPSHGVLALHHANNLQHLRLVATANRGTEPAARASGCLPR